MRLLDLFCGAGGAAMGYHQAGFDEIVGVDIKPQRHYPFEFVLGDALEYAAAHGEEFDLIHASPPCQAYSSMRSIWGGREYPTYIEATRSLLQETGKRYAIENVMGAPLENPVMLCGTMFGLLVIRHRLFETAPLLVMGPGVCKHERKVVKCGRPPDREKHYHSVAGHFSDVEFAREAMGIDWMTQTELAQAIPPAYTEWVGRRIVDDN